MIRLIIIIVISFAAPTFVFAQKPFHLAPAVCIEAEDFKIESGWRVIKNGEGNYMVDMIGFNHISGERVLGVDAKDAAASAFADIVVPEAGDYRLWVRYEYPPFSEARFRVEIRQGSRLALATVMGAKDNPRFAFGETKARPQYDPSWGPEGLVDEAVTVKGLAKGPARVSLKSIAQPSIPGRTANRNIDFVYLTRDTNDAWLEHYSKLTNLYPILDAFRDSRGPRWEVRFTNRGTKPAGLQVNHHYNRIPWGLNEGIVATDIKPGETSNWIGLKKQDTAHYGLIQFSGTTNEAFDLDIRPSGGAEVARSAKNEKAYAFYFPHYPHWGEKIISQREAIDQARGVLAKAPKIGRAPTLPLCYGGWIPIGRDDEIGREYAKLYADIGMRVTPAAPFGSATLKNLEAAGIKRTRSEQAMTYRNPPTAANITAAKKQFAGPELSFLQWYDYGDEIGFGEWIGMMLQERMQQPSSGPKPTPESILSQEWQRWLNANRKDVKREEYWLPGWGAFDAAKLKPSSSAETANSNQRLYVDSIIFYEDLAMQFAAEGMKLAKRELGADVWCGANYSGHPFYFPTSTMYIKWFRRGCADMGRHSDYFWQVGQAGPMINGYFAEHFRSGFRNNPKAVLRQYNMPHVPGNSDASFLRSAFTHLAHGAKMLDFFGIGMNDSWTENYVDFRFPERYTSIRDVTHALGFVEDAILESRVMASPVALLVSESTERWDFAGIATDQAGHAHFGPSFRKTRLHHHIERLGIWKALTFLGFPPDLITEEDLTPEVLKGFKLLVIVGDCLNPDVATNIEPWIRAGGVLLATSRAGLHDQYFRAKNSLSPILGLKSRESAEPTDVFMRVRQELPYLKPSATISGSGWKMPVLAANESIVVGPETQVLATFDSNKSPALTLHNLGKGQVYYTPTYPGISSLWAALQPPIVADRSPTSHIVPQNFDPGARALLELAIKGAKLDPEVKRDQPLLDMRLIETKTGYMLPIANYHQEVGQKVMLEVRVNGAIRKVSSAYRGDIPFTLKDGRCMIALSPLGYGDILRLDR